MCSVKAKRRFKYKATTNKVTAAKPTLNSINTAGPKLLAAIRINKNDAPQIAARKNNRSKLAKVMIVF